MSKINQTKHRLRSDPDGMLAWMDGGHLPRMSYESAEITGIQLSMMLDGHDDVYILSILPSDEYGHYDAWLRRMGSEDMLHMLSRRARDPEDAEYDINLLHPATRIHRQYIIPGVQG